MGSASILHLRLAFRLLSRAAERGGEYLTHKDSAANRPGAQRGYNIPAAHYIVPRPFDRAT